MRSAPDPHGLRFWRGHLTGADGAFTMLDCVRSDISRLNASGNALGDEGFTVLIHGLDSFRYDLASPIHGLWGLSTLRLSNTGLTDRSLKTVLDYAGRDTRLKRLDIERNNIDLSNDLTSIMTSLNSTHLTELSLAVDKHISPSAISYFLDNLFLPTLERLTLGIHPAIPKSAEALAAYLASPRSRGLSELYLPGKPFDADSVKVILDAVERSNHSLQVLAVSDREHPHLGCRGSVIEDTFHPPPPPDERLVSLLTRNRALTGRIQSAALRCLPYARILLNAGQPSSGTSSASPTTHFPLLRLPPEVISLIVRQTSGDAAAFSHAQFARLLQDATGKEGLARSIQQASAQEMAWPTDYDDPFGSKIGPAEAWLKSGGWEIWEKE